MNRRTLKQHCRRAVRILIAEHGCRAEDFQPSDGEEAVDAPTRMERRFVEHGFLHPGPLAGTPLLWLKASYEYDEWDAHLPSEFLKEILVWADFEPSAEEIAKDEEWVRQKNAELVAA